MKHPGIYKFVITYADIAKIKGIKRESVAVAAYRGDFDPNDLASITRYVYPESIRELKETLNFWKKKCKEEVNNIGERQA